MHSTLNFLLTRPVTTGMAFLMILVLGVFAALRIPLELNPKIELPRVTIYAQWAGASAETIEGTITSPMEEIAATIPGAKNITSESSMGSSMVDIEFQPEIDLTLAILELNEKLLRLSEKFPAGVIPFTSKYVPKEVEEQRFMTYSLASAMEESTLKKIANEKIKPALLSIPGVSDLKVLGGASRQVKILLDEKKMLSFGLSFENVYTKITEADIIKNLGAQKDKNIIYPVLLRQELKSIQELSQIPIKISKDKIIHLGDISEILEASEDKLVLRRINSEPAITLEIIKEPGKNILRTAESVQKKIETLEKDMPLIRFRKVYDQSLRLKEELESLYKQSLVSLLGVFLVLLVFLRNLKSPLIILSAILFSIITVILFFSFLDITLNVLTLSGLSLGIGMLVDNSIVVYENIEFHKRSSKEFKLLVKEAVSEVSAPLIGSTFTTAVVFIPFFFLPEELRRMFLYFGLGMALSIIISLVYSLTFIPFVIYKFDNSPKEEIKEKKIFPFLKKLNPVRIYEKLLRKVIKFRKSFVILFIWLLGLPLWFLPDKIDIPVVKNFYSNTFGSAFFTDNKEIIYKILGGSWYIFKSNVSQNDFSNFYGMDTYLQAYLQSEQGTDIKVLNEIIGKVESRLTEFSEYINTINTTVYENYAMMKIDFKKEYSETTIPLILKSKLSGYFTEFGGIHASIMGYGMTFSAGASFYETSTLQLDFLGYNYKTVKDLAQEFRIKVEQNPRVENVNIDKSNWGRNTFEIVGEINRKKIAEAGLTVTRVLSIVHAYTGGRSIFKNMLINGEKLSFDIKFKGYEDFQASDLLNTVFLDNTGKPALLKDFIELKREKTLTTIHRQKQQYSRTISLDFLGPSEYAWEYVHAVLKTIQLPYGYSVRSGYYGYFTEQDKIAFAYMILAAVILVFMVTAALYESFKKPFIIILSVPMALIGLFLIYYFTDTNFGKSGYAGLILLIGLAVNNAIVLIDYISKLTDKGIPLDEAIVSGTIRRTKPIIMTTLTTIIGLLPFIIIGDKKSLWYGLSLSVIGGLISSTIMVLIVLPAMCRIIFKPKYMEPS